MQLVADIPIEFWQKYAPQDIADRIQVIMRKQFVDQKTNFSYDLEDHGFHKIARADITLAQWQTGAPEIIGEHSKDLILDVNGKKCIGFMTKAGSWRTSTGYLEKPVRWMEIPN